MNTNTTELRSFPPAEDLYNFIVNIDYVKLKNQIINVSATVAAVTMVLLTLMLNSILKFWADHGEMIQAKATRAVDYGYMAAAVMYNQGKNVGERYYSFRDLVKQVSV